MARAAQGNEVLADGHKGRFWQELQDEHNGTKSEWKGAGRGVGPVAFRRAWSRLVALRRFCMELFIWRAGKDIPFCVQRGSMGDPPSLSKSHGVAVRRRKRNVSEAKCRTPIFPALRNIYVGRQYFSFGQAVAAQFHFPVWKQPAKWLFHPHFEL
jgi:hypothetical protein